MTEKEKKDFFQKEGGTLVNIIWKPIRLIEGRKTTKYFPANSEVEDECGEMTDFDQCDYDKVKHKDPQLSIFS